MKKLRATLCNSKYQKINEFYKYFFLAFLINLETGFYIIFINLENYKKLQELLKRKFIKIR